MDTYLQAWPWARCRRPFLGRICSALFVSCAVWLTPAALAPTSALAQGTRDGSGSAAAQQACENITQNRNARVGGASAGGSRNACDPGVAPPDDAALAAENQRRLKEHFESQRAAGAAANAAAAANPMAWAAPTREDLLKAERLARPGLIVLDFDDCGTGKDCLETARTGLRHDGRIGPLRRGVKEKVLLAGDGAEGLRLDFPGDNRPKTVAFDIIGDRTRKAPLLVRSATEINRIPDQHFYDGIETGTARIPSRVRYVILEKTDPTDTAPIAIDNLRLEYEGGAGSARPEMAAVRPPAAPDQQIVRHGALTAHFPNPSPCAKSIAVRVDADRPDLYRGDRTELQRLLAAVRSLYSLNCPDLLAASVEGRSRGDLLFRGEMRADRAWRLFGSDVR